MGEAATLSKGFLIRAVRGFSCGFWTRSDATEFPVYERLRSLPELAFAQLTYRECLRGIEACLRAQPAIAYRMRFRGRVTRTNLAYANDHRDWQVFAGIVAVLMRRAQRLYADQPPVVSLEADLFALDATVIELRLALLPWARWKQDLASVKLNVLLDLPPICRSSLHNQIS